MPDIQNQYVYDTKIAKLETEIAKLKQDHETEVAKLKQDHETQIAKLKEEMTCNNPKTIGEYLNSEYPVSIR